MFTSEETTIKDMFFPMDKLPEGQDKPVSELDKVEFEVVSRE